MWLNKDIAHLFNQFLARSLFQIWSLTATHGYLCCRYFSQLLSFLTQDFGEIFDPKVLKKQMQRQFKLELKVSCFLKLGMYSLVVTTETTCMPLFLCSTPHAVLYSSCCALLLMLCSTPHAMLYSSCYALLLMVYYLSGPAYVQLRKLNCMRKITRLSSGKCAREPGDESLGTRLNFIYKC